MSSLIDVFTRRDAILTGVTDRDLADMVASGAVVRVAQGVYRIGNDRTVDPCSLTAMAMVLSHQSAAAWWGADTPFGAGLHATVPRNRHRRARWNGVTVHRTDLAGCDVTSLRDVCLTTPVRTILDIARIVPLAQAVAIGDSLCRATGVSVPLVRAAAAALPNGIGRPATRLVADLLDPRAESVFESITRIGLVTAGLPTPVSQLAVVCDGRWLARVDFAWPAHRVICECDGYEFHGSREAFERDRQRWSDLTRAGWKVIVVTWRQVIDDPTYAASAVRDLLAETTHIPSPRGVA